MRPNDSNLTPEQCRAIRAHALRALETADALGRLPTPVTDVMEAAKLIVADEDELSESFVEKIRNNVIRAKKVLKKAISKIFGVLDVPGRIVYIHKAVPAIKRVFLKLHETGHSVIPWQRDVYCAIEDCEKTLAPEIADIFDREANAFASEVLFQLDTFKNEAADHQFGIGVPLKLSKKYGASVYSTVRRYVSSNHRTCSVLVLEPPELIIGDGFRCLCRRVVQSDCFTSIFGEMQWPAAITPDDPIGAFIPIGDRKMSRPAEIRLTDQNGTEHECVAEGFKYKYYVFILIHEVSTITHKTIAF